LLAAQEQSAREVSKGHGRREVRTLRTTTLLNDYRADWPGVQQVYWLRRERTEDGRTSVEDEYGITSLPRDRADATRLLGLRRGHWGIENRLHYVRDVTLGEDACRVRRGAGAGVLAGLRNAAIALLAGLGLASIAEATRHCLFRPRRAIRLLFSSG
jgi:Transposase DDE domain